MLDHQTPSVRACFAALAPFKAQIASLFYGRLFTVAPQLRPLFSTDETVNRDALISALAPVVAGRDRLETIVPRLQELGRAYAGRGVTEDHYALAGETWLWALEQALGPAFAPRDQQAWREAYDLVSEVMIAAARRVPERCAARLSAA